MCMCVYVCKCAAVVIDDGVFAFLVYSCSVYLDSDLCCATLVEYYMYACKEQFSHNFVCNFLASCEIVFLRLHSWYIEKIIYY